MSHLSSGPADRLAGMLPRSRRKLGRGEAWCRCWWSSSGDNKEETTNGTDSSRTNSEQFLSPHFYQKLDAAHGARSSFEPQTGHPVSGHSCRKCHQVSKRCKYHCTEYHDDCSSQSNRRTCCVQSSQSTNGLTMSSDERNKKPVAAGRVRRVCQDWQVLEDEGLAHQLQNHEINEHYDRNRQNSRLIRDDFHAARREQLSEQQLLELARRQEELEAEELASQLAQLLDEEKHEEESQRRDEQLARRIAQEEDELIAQEQQDRELARMLQAKERLKARKLREARKLAEERRRREEESRSQRSNEIGEEYSDEALNEALYANLGPIQARHPDVLGSSSIYLLQNSDILNPPGNLDVHQGSPTSTARSARSAEGARNTPSSQSISVAREGARKTPSRNPADARNEGAIPPYMPMQGLTNRLPSGTTMPPTAVSGTTGHTPQETHKKNSSCKTQ